MTRTKELTEARRLQALEKEKLLQEQAIQDRDEFQKIIEAQKEVREVEIKAIQERAQRVALAHAAKRKRFRTEEADRNKRGDGEAGFQTEVRGRKEDQRHAGQQQEDAREDQARKARTDARVGHPGQVPSRSLEDGGLIRS